MYKEAKVSKKLIFNVKGGNFLYGTHPLSVSLIHTHRRTDTHVPAVAQTSNLVYGNCTVKFLAVYIAVYS